MEVYENIQSAIDNVDPSETPFIIKQVINRKLCDKAVSEIEGYLNTYDSNENFFGKNWHYKVDKHDTEFVSFMFNELCSLPQSVLPNIYSEIYNAYQSFGDDIPHDFFFHLKQGIKGKTINPLVFWYPHGVGWFCVWI